MKKTAPAPVVQETRYSMLQLREGDMIDLASGFVPLTVRARALALLDERGEYERNAARPQRER